MEISSEQEIKSTQKIKSKKGGLRTMPFIIANETFEKVASFGLIANMILYLMNEYHMDPVAGASLLFLWSAISHFTPVIGAFLSDSYFGRFRMIAYGTVFSLLGLTVLWLTAIIPQARPPHCNNPNVEKCKPPTSAQLALLLSSFALMSIGAGGIRPCSLAFGADQFNEADNLKKEKILQSFFNWYLNKACIIRNLVKDLDSNGMALNPWSLCTTTQVEELKALLKVLFVWSTGIMVSVTLNQQAFSVLQASTMDRHVVNKFKIPAASLGVFGILSMAATVAIYDLVGVPLLSKFTKLKRGLSLKERMGIGVALTCVATAMSAVVEGKRRNTAIREGLSDDPHAVVNMSAMWLVPQYCLHGIAEAFNAIGQIQFYYSQFPKSMSSIAMALLSLGMGVGNLFASLIVYIVDDVTKRGGNVSWVSKNLNKGHYDYYYWVLTILGVVNVFYYILCSWAYGSEDDKVEGVKEEDMPKSYNYTP
ncbi:protein NRT1/ PTR FAMILY 1.2-like isoform X2 [Alnus glutinosa]|uniref:protein NRT1/ PTR FAMILY 1.2-like isoform X2 n=1 Tax=Alnus glutinosa TaxID=3517 RepID=UPI002D7993AB|nr:protein NRT1/ PTR FAMILY 1.2-like isoform X2 [Alnus glutinosa]